MTNLLTQSEVYDLGRRAGFVPVNARIFAAVAMCEAPALRDGIAHSNFDAIGDQALANATWGYSYSGVQIRSLRAHKGTGQYRDEDKLVDPEFAARSARTIKLAAGGWSPWTTFAKGTYKAYLLDADGEIAFPPPPGSYVVRSGDTLSGIALRLGGFTWQELAATNGLVSPYLLSIGQILLLPFDRQGV